MVGGNLREAMLAMGIVNFELIDVLRYLLRDTNSLFMRQLSKPFLEKTKRPLTEDAVMRILTAHAIMTSYPVSADEYFSNRHSSKPMFLYLDKMCSPEEYAAFFALLEGGDAPSGDRLRTGVRGERPPHRDDEGNGEDERLSPRRPAREGR